MSSGISDSGGSTSERGPGERGRRAILEAAVRTLSANPGASLQEIAGAAQVGRATVYRHFSSKEELVRAVAADALAYAESALDAARLEEGPVVEVVERLARALVPVGERFHFLLGEPQLDSDPGYLAEERRVAGSLEELVRRGKREGAFRAEVPEAWIVGTIVALVFAAWEGVHYGRLAPLDAPELVRSTILYGLSRRE